MKNITIKIAIFFKLITESISFAIGSLKGDKFRTFLSLFGVTIGIFSIVSVFTAIDALKSNVETGLNSLGSNTVYIDRFPWSPDETGEYKWWEFMTRPAVKIEEFNFLKENSKTLDNIAFVSSTNLNLKYKRYYINNINVVAPTYDWEKINNLNIEKGRYFSIYESKTSNPVAIIGYEIAQTLFPEENPLNKVIRVGNSKALVIGVLKKSGESIVNVFDNDNSIIIPYSSASTIFNVKRASTMITATPKEDINREEFIQELKNLMRSIRRLKPQQKDSFAINEMTFILNSTKQIFSGINLAGWIIGGFSILIGGFGIANIMFVSVKERTNLIGIQKALGAKKFTILTQFLAEAVFLAIAGGAFGILFVFLVVVALGDIEAFPMKLSVYNILRGLIISSTIGVIAGFLPAKTAADLNPVDAINSK